MPKSNVSLLGFLALNLSPCVLTYLLHVVVERDPHALLAAEHLAGHECVEDPRAGQREAKVEAKQPPVLHFLIKLEPNPPQKTGPSVIDIFDTHLSYINR